MSATLMYLFGVTLGIAASVLLCAAYSVIDSAINRDRRCELVLKALSSGDKTALQLEMETELRLGSLYVTLHWLIKEGAVKGYWGESEGFGRYYYTKIRDRRRRKPARSEKTSTPSFTWILEVACNYGGWAWE